MMMRKMVAILGAALAISSAGPASAANFALALGPGTSSVYFGGSSSAAGVISHTFGFTVPGGKINGFVGSIALTRSLDVILSSVLLDSKPFNVVSSGVVDLLTLDSTEINAGAHTVTVHGRWGSAGGSYAGTLNYVVTAVPEPATWTLIIGGFGMVGGTMRRRRTVARVTYA